MKEACGCRDSAQHGRCFVYNMLTEFRMPILLNYVVTSVVRHSPHIVEYAAKCSEIGSRSEQCNLCTFTSCPTLIDEKMTISSVY